jgi:hypothetical protein
MNTSVKMIPIYLTNNKADLMETKRGCHVRKFGNHCCKTVADHMSFVLAAIRCDDNIKMKHTVTNSSLVVSFKIKLLGTGLLNYHVALKWNHQLSFKF